MIHRTSRLLMLMMLAACQSEPDVTADLAALKEARAPAAAPPLAAPKIDWAALGSCRNQLGELARLVATGSEIDGSSLPFGVVVGPAVGRDRLSAPAVPIVTDLPVPVGDGRARQAPCLLRVGLPLDVESRRRIVGQETVASEYQSGVQREDNPAYALAKARVDMARRQTGHDDEVWSGVGDPMIDLVGLLVGSIVEGFSEGARESDLNEAMVELARTPRKIDRPTYVGYHYDRVAVEAARRASIPIELVDRRQGTTWRTTIRHAEQRRFHIPQGISRRDRSYPEQTSQRDLKAWLRSPPELPVSRLVEGLLRETPANGRRARDEPRAADPGDGGWLEPGAAGGGEDPDLAAGLDEPAGVFEDDTEPTWSDDRAGRASLGAGFERPLAASGRSRPIGQTASEPSRIALSDAGAAGQWQDPFAARKSRASDRQTADLSADPRFRSVVVIRSGSTLGSGFYVAPHLVVTNHHVVQEDDMVDLSSVGGSRVMGMVVANDVGRDLALVHTPQPGPPVALYHGPELRPGTTVDAIGAPHGYDFTLTRGVVSAIRTRPALLVPSMQQVRYVQTDADINHGNSGGPLFVGEEVIGVNDRVDPKAVSGGLNFAIHVDELRAFLEEEGVALPAVAGPLEDRAGRAGNG